MKKNKVLSAMKISSIFVIFLYFSLFLINIIHKRETINSKEKHKLETPSLTKCLKDKNHKTNKTEIYIKNSKIEDQKDNAERRISFCYGLLTRFKEFIKSFNLKKFDSLDSVISDDQVCKLEEEPFIKYAYLGVVFILGAFINVKECLKLGIL